MGVFKFALNKGKEIIADRNKVAERAIRKEVEDLGLDDELGNDFKVVVDGKQVKLDLTATCKPVQVDATVNFVAPTIDPSSGLLKVTATFDNSDVTIRPGVGGTMTWNAN